MKVRILSCAAAIVLVLCLSASAPCLAAEVAQGKCVNYDENKKVLVIDEFDLDFTKDHKYGKPTGKQLTFSVADALIGITPRPGDVCRIAFEEKGGEKKAIRVMNVTRQDLMKK